MATTEEFLISLGIDPKSIQTIVDNFQALKTKIESTPIQIPVDEANAAAALGDVGKTAAAVFTAADEAAAQFEDGIRDISAGLGELKTSLIAVSGAAALVAGLGFGQAAEESRSLARANVILGETTEGLRVKQEQLRQVADETGLTYAQVAEALFDVASAGFEGDKAVDAIRASAQAAVPAGIDLATAFNAIATAQNNFSITSEEAGDKLVKIADLTRGTLANVSAALGRIAPTAASVGISLDEVGAAFATITNKGESAEEASTLLFNAINKFLAPADEAAKQLNRIGVATGDAAFHNQSLAEKLELVARAASKGTLELGKVFDIRAGRAIRAIVADMDKFRENMDEVANSTGRTREGMESFFQNLGPQWDLFKTQVTNAATAIGQDLLEAIVPVLAAVGDFIEQNQTLVALLVEAALVVGALAAAWLAYHVVVKQVQAAGLVLQGISKILTANLGLEAQALAAVTAAWWAKLTAMLANVKAGIAKVIGFIGAALAIETGAVWASIRAWTAKIALNLGSAFFGILNLVGKLIAAIILETKALWANTVATGANAAAQTTLRGKMNALVGVFGKAWTSVSALGVAAGAAGAAFIGWNIGKLIGDLLGLEKASNDYAETGKVTIKAAFINAFTFDALARAAASAKEALEKLNKLTAQQAQRLNANAEEQARYNEFLAAGLDHIDAYIGAVGGLTAELRALNRIDQRGGVLTEEQTRRRLQLETLINKKQQEQATAVRRIRNEAEALKVAQETITSTQEEWTEAVKQTAEQYRLLRRADLAESVADIGKFEAGFETIVKRLQSFTTQLGSLESQREAIIEKGGKNVEAALARNAVAIADKIENINAIFETLDNQIAIVNDRIIENGKAFIARLKANAQDEIEVYRNSVDDTIKEEERRLSETKKLLDKLISARDKAASAAEGFARRLEEAAIRRRDPQLLEIIRLERQYAEVIKQGIPDQETRTRTITALTEELKRLAGAARDEIRLREELRRVEQELTEARGDEGERSADRMVDLLNQQEEITTKLAEVEETRDQRRIKAEQVLKTAVEGSEKAVASFEAREDKITKLEKQRADAQENLKRIATELEIVQAKIRDRLKEQVTQAKAVVQQQLESIRLAERTASAIAEGTGTGAAEFQARVQQLRDVLKKEFEGLRDVGLDDIAQGVRDASAEIDAIAGESGAVVDWLTTLKDNLTTTSDSVVEDTKVIVPLATAATETFNDLQGTFEPSSDALRDLAESANEFAPAVQEFADETVEKLGETTTALRTTAARVAANTAEIARLQAEGVSGTGLPE